jgi:SsrA-binding protein
MSKLITKNKKAYFDYFIITDFTAGVKLTGSEVKSIRNNDVHLNEAYCYINHGEIFVKNMHIAEFNHGGKHSNHEPLRERKLLLKKKEIFYIDESIKRLRYTIIPLAIVITNKGFIKMEIGLAKGKKLYDKRLSLKIKDSQKNLKKEINQI